MKPSFLTAARWLRKRLSTAISKQDVMANNAGFLQSCFAPLQADEWTNVLRLSTRTDTRADTKAVGTVTHVLLYSSAPALVSVEYVGDTYVLWS